MFKSDRIRFYFHFSVYPAVEAVLLLPAIAAGHIFNVVIVAEGYGAG
jgi:hypothetical protein